MRRIALTNLFFLAATCLCLGRTDPGTQQSLAAAEQQADIFSDDAGPWQMEVDFIAQVREPLNGHLTLKWAATDRWWRKITLAEFQETDIRTGDKLYISRNLGYTPLRVKDLLSLIQFSNKPGPWQVKKEKQRTEDGIQMTCIQARSAQPKTHPEETHELCLDAASHDLLSDEWKDNPDHMFRRDYGQESGFRGHRFPRSLVWFDNGSKVLSANVVTLETAPLDPALLVPPQGAIERRQCDDLKPPVPIKIPDPTYPESASQNRLMGDTTVAMTVLTDGSVENIQIVGRATHGMDEATVQTLKRWKFKPAMCGTEPVVFDIEVIVSFRLD
jgi:TonB family protein